MPSAPGATSAATRPIRCQPPTWIASRRQRGGPRRRPTGSTGIYVVTDPDQLRALSEVWRGAGHIAGAAAAIALVVPRTDDDRTRLLDYYDLGQATYAMALAAADLGIGTGHASVGDQDQARKILGVPSRIRRGLPPRRGLPADRPLRSIAKPGRRPLGEVIHHGRW